MTVRPASGRRALLAATGAALLLVGLLAAGLLTGPTAATAQTASPPASPAVSAQTNATLRAVHAVPGAPSVDVLIDGKPTIQNLAFGSGSPYAAIAPATHQLQVVPTGQSGGTALVTLNFDAGSGKAYLLTIWGSGTAIEGKLSEVDLSSLGQDKARVRLINASPDAGKLDLVVPGGNTIASGVDFKNISDYSEVKAGAYNLELRKSGGPAVATTNLTFAGGEIYDLVALGQTSNNSLKLVALITPRAVDCAQVLGLGGTGNACVRFVHAATGMGAVDVYVGDLAVAKGFNFGTATNFIALPSGSNRPIRVVAAGQAPPANQNNGTAGFDAGKAYQVIVFAGGGGGASNATGGAAGAANATGAGAAANATGGNATGGQGGIQLRADTIDLTPIPGGQARLRVTHVATGVGAVDVAAANGPTLFQGIGYGSASDYATVNAGPITFQVRAAGQTANLIEQAATLEAGNVYDVIAVWSTPDKSLKLLVLTTKTVQAAGAVATPGTTPVASPMASAAA